ncbi:MAG: hypothetical protein LEGION0403_FIIPPAGN_02390 [Legionella sp.]
MMFLARYLNKQPMAEVERSDANRVVENVT